MFPNSVDLEDVRKKFCIDEDVRKKFCIWRDKYHMRLLEKTGDGSASLGDRDFALYQEEPELIRREGCQGNAVVSEDAQRVSEMSRALWGEIGSLN